MQLEDLLRRQLADHEQMLQLLERKREALRGADQQQLTRCCALENQTVRSISELEKQRLKLMGELTLMLDPGAAQPWRLVELAERMDEPWRGRLLVLRAQLKDKMESIRRQTRIAQRTVESLYKHMHGLIVTVGSVCSGVVTYGQRGVRPRSAVAVSTFSTTA